MANCEREREKRSYSGSSSEGNKTVAEQKKEIYDLSGQVARRVCKMITCSKQGEQEGMKRQRKGRRRTQRRRARRVRRCCDLRASHMTKSKASLVWHLSVATAWSPVRSRHRVLRSLVCDSVQYFALQCAGKATQRERERERDKEREHCAAWCPLFSQSGRQQTAGSLNRRPATPLPPASSCSCLCLFFLLLLYVN